MTRTIGSFQTAAPLSPTRQPPQEAGGGRELGAFVLYDQDHRQLPDGGQVEPLVEVAGRGGAVTDEVDGDAVRAVLAECEGAPRGHRDHRAEMADHAEVEDAVLGRQMAVVERALHPLR